MIEELKIVQEIFGDLSSIGIWAIVAYFFYKLCIIAAWLGALLIGLKVSHNIYKSLLVEKDNSDYEFNNMKKNLAEKTAEVERVQHMYKLLCDAASSKEKL